MINIPNLPQILPWFIFDISNQQLITSPTIPSDIADSKSIILSEQPIPGLSYQPIQSGGMGNRKISFTLNLVKRNGVYGNMNMLKQFDNLRQPAFSFKNIFQKSTQFTPNPKVLYFWGIGSVPLIWYVSKCDFSHKQHWVNAFGNPQYSEISMELILDETSPVNRTEEITRQLMSLAGMTEGLVDLGLNYASKKVF